MKTLHGWIAAVIALVAPAPAWASIALAAAPPPAIAYRPFQGDMRSEVMALTLRNEGDSAQAVRLRLAPSDGGALRWPGLPQLAPLAAIGGDRLVAGDLTHALSLPAGDRRAIPVSWRVLDRGFAAPGTYTLHVDVTVEDAASGATLAAATRVPVTLEVVADTALSIAGTSGSLSADRSFAFIDFGTLESGEGAFILFQMRANADVAVTIASEQGGALARRDDPRHRVPYRATFDGAPLALAGPVVVTRRPDPTMQGSHYRLDVTIGDVSGSFAGAYRDVISVEIRPV